MRARKPQQTVSPQPRSAPPGPPAQVDWRDGSLASQRWQEAADLARVWAAAAAQRSPDHGKQLFECLPDWLTCECLVAGPAGRPGMLGSNERRRGLPAYCSGLAAIRRGELAAARMQLERERFEEERQRRQAEEQARQSRSRGQGGIRPETLAKIEKELRLL